MRDELHITRASQWTDAEQHPITRNAAQSGLSLGSVALIVLKLTGVIDWSWWWVLAAVWISGILLVAVRCGLAVLLSWGWAEGRK